MCIMTQQQTCPIATTHCHRGTRSSKRESYRQLPTQQCWADNMSQPSMCSISKPKKSTFAGNWCMVCFCKVLLTENSKNEHTKPPTGWYQRSEARNASPLWLSSQGIFSGDSNWGSKIILECLRNRAPGVVSTSANDYIYPPLAFWKSSGNTSQLLVLATATEQDRLYFLL